MRISGKIDIPIQIVVAKELGSEYLPLEILTGRAKEADVRTFLSFREGLTRKGDVEDALARRATGNCFRRFGRMSVCRVF